MSIIKKDWIITYVQIEISYYRKFLSEDAKKFF